MSTKKAAKAKKQKTKTKTVERVIDIDRQWAIGEAVTPGFSGPPQRIPDPPAGPYALPARCPTCHGSGLGGQPKEAE